MSRRRSSACELRSATGNRQLTVHGIADIGQGKYFYEAARLDTDESKPRGAFNDLRVTARAASGAAENQVGRTGNRALKPKDEAGGIRGRAAPRAGLSPPKAGSDDPHKPRLPHRTAAG